MNIFLIGFMGVGKTSKGKKIAAKLGLVFFDLDVYIAENEEKSIGYIFDNYGEKYFRDAEKKYLEHFFNQKDFVLATGGGTPCFNDNISRINDNGLSIYLKMSNNALVSRLKASKKKRPIVETHGQGELINLVENMMSERHKYYEQAKLTIDALNFDVNEVIKIIKDYP